MLIGTKHSGYSRANIRLYFDPVTLMAAGTAEAAAITAAEIAAAEAAAVAAAEVAAAEAAALAAQQAAAATAAEAGAAQAASSAFNPAGIMEIGGTTAAPGAAPLTTAAEVQTAAQGAGQPTAQEIYRQAANASINPGVVTDASSNLATQGTQMLPQRSFDFSSVDKLYNEALSKGAGPEAMSFDSFGNPVPVSSPAYSSADPTGLAQMSLDANAAPSGPSTFDKLLNYADKNPFKTGAAMYVGASKLGLLDPSKETFNDDPYDGPLSKYRLSPDFKGSTATPNIYRPTYPTYAAEGGIMSAAPVQAMSDQNNALGYQQAMAATGGQVSNFAAGGKTGSLTDSLDYYKQMMSGKSPPAPSERASVGIFRDSDPDTRTRDALTAALIRNSKASKGANLSIPSMKRPTPMGQINLAAPGIKRSNKEDVEEAAGGGIMALAQGGYIYDPVKQMYVTKPTGGISGASGDSGGSGGPSGPIAPTTPEEFAVQSAQNQKINDFLTGVLPAIFSPGSTIARAFLDTPFAGGIANALSPPGSQPNYGVPVDSRGTYSNNPMGLTSYESGRGNPAEQGSDTGGGAGIGGGDISGQAEGTPAIARGGLLAQGGISNLGDYSDGGRLLRGPGDGISDSIPAMIGKKQPARLADGEFVVPARIVSELGNGSTEAGARKLYAMMDRIQKARKKTVGKGKVAVNSRSVKYLPK